MFASCAERVNDFDAITMIRRSSKEATEHVELPEELNIHCIDIVPSCVAWAELGYVTVLVFIFPNTIRACSCLECVESTHDIRVVQFTCVVSH